MTAMTRRRRAALWVGLGVGAVCLAAVSSEPNLRRRTGVGSLAHDLQRAVLHQAYSAYEDDPPVQCWGDSLTAGPGATFGHDYPSLIRTLYHRPASNEGIGGQTSTEVRTRMLARARDGRPEIAVIWVGRNNFRDAATVQADIDAMIASLLPGSRYLVLEVLNGAWEGERRGHQDFRILADLNAALAARYGPHFVPLRQRLLDHADRNLAPDVADRDGGVVPASLRWDELHLNDMGQAVVAAEVDFALRSSDPRP